ncbi:MAG: hypothetical protein ACOH2R_07480 [Pseudomonas sp.]
MSIKPITEQQKAVLKAAATGGIKSRASIYPEPTVEPVNAFGVLQPDVTGIDNVFIVVSYEKMPNNDTIFCYWDGDTTSIAPVTADTKPKRIPVPDALVIAASGKTINVIYSVIDDANPGGVPSDVHTQVIERYTPPVYPPPVITEAQGGVLDVGALTRNANVTVAAWPGIAVGQRIWLSMTSTPPVTLTKWVGFAITNIGTQATTISLEKLKTLVDGSSIVLHLEVSSDGGVTRVSFPTQTYTIRQVLLVAPIITSIKDANGVDIPNGGTTAQTQVTLEGEAASNQRVDILDGTDSKGITTVDINGKWTLTLSGLTAKTYSIKAKGLYGTQPESAVRVFTVSASVSGYDDFEGEPAVEFSPNLPKTLGSGLTVTLRQGQSSISYTTSPHPIMGYRYLAINMGSKVYIAINGVCSKIDFLVYANETASSSVTYFDAEGSIVSSQHLPNVGYVTTNVSYTAPSGRSIAAFEVFIAFDSAFYSMIDNIRWS